MARLNADAEVIARNLERIKREIGEICERSGRSKDAVRICVATKYVDAEGMAALREAGVEIAAENRLQDLIAKQEQFKDDFEWHFIGAIQSRKIAEIAARVSTIHSLSSPSARDRLARLSGAPPEILIQVNVSREESKQGVDPAELDEFIAGCPYPVSGLMTMPPLSPDPEAARPHFRALHELAASRGLEQLSIGTSQDYLVAVEEGATLVRIGSVLFDTSTE